MARDRFVHFESRAPSREEVQRILENYFGGAGTIEESNPSWWVITLPGKPTSPFDGIDGHGPLPNMPPDEQTRWIEVIYTKGVRLMEANLDVLTRHQDEFTNGIADQLARAFARFYSGKLDMA